MLSTKKLLTVPILFILISHVSFAWYYSMSMDNSPVCLSADSAGVELIVANPYAGFWLTNDSGNSWLPINSLISDRENIFPLGIGVTGPNDSIVFVKYIFTNDGLKLSNIKVSRLNRSIWEDLTVLDYWPDNMDVEGYFDELIVAPDNPDLWYTYTRNGFARSSDGGETWQVTRIPSYQNHFAFLDPNDSNTIYLTNESSLLYSTDGGESFLGLTNVSEPGYDDNWIVSVNRLQDNSLLIATFEQIPHPDTGNPTCLKRSFDDGETWEWVEMSGIPDDFYGKEIIVIPDQPGLLYYHVYVKQHLYRSEDYGNNWERVTGIVDRLHSSGKPYYNSVSGAFYYPVEGFGLFVSYDGGYSWDQISSPEIGTPLGNNDCLKCSPEGLSVTDKSGRFWSTNNSGSNFHEEIYTLSPDTLFQVSPTNIDSNGFRIRYVGKWKRNEGFTNSIYYSYDSGTTWHERLFELEGTTFIQTGMFSVRNDDELLLFSLYHTDTKYYVSNDTGRTWEVKELGFRQGFTQKINNFLLIQDLINMELKVSHDLGDSWESIGYPDGATWEFYPWALYSDSTLFIRASEQCWAYTSDGIWEERGEIFADDIGQFHPNEFFWELVKTSRDTFMVAGSRDTPGLYVSTDWGWTWERNDLGMTWENQGRIINKIVYDKYRDRLWIDTGAGLAYLNEPSLGVDGEVELIPATFETLSAYPNPFNNSTKITYSIPEKGQVKIEVFDILGRKVSTLFDEVSEPGLHSINFDGNGLATGAYFIHMTNDGNTKTRKITLLK